MAFNTFTFAVFFVVVLLGYALFPKRYKWCFLLCASYFFYLYASAKFFVSICITTITSWLGALWIEKIKSEEKNVLQKNQTEHSEKKIKEQMKKRKKQVLVFTLVLNFGILAFLKYFNFFAANLNSLFEHFSFDGEIPTLNLILPLGISFYTFQTMSYLIDVYWGRATAQRNLGKLALFISFFPQIIEGPIGRYNDLAPQLYAERRINSFEIRRGIQLMLWGYFKKMVIADRVAIVADFVFSNYLNISGFGVGIGIFLYAIQDYTDFSGCIDIARGCARTMGITMAENFRRPYFAKTIPDFWRRWHISLGAWMKDYVFYPFSLNKNVRKLGKLAKAHYGKHIGRSLPIALGNLLVFFLVGLWHGANWNYIAWGIFYGLVIAISGMLKPVYEWLNKCLHINVENKAFQLFQILRTFGITCIGCVIFRSSTLNDGIQMILRIPSLLNVDTVWYKELLSFGLDKWNWILLAISLIVLFIVDVFQEKTSVGDWLDQRIAVLRWTIYAAASMALILFGMYGAGLNPTQFVYMQF